MQERGSERLVVSQSQRPAEASRVSPTPTPRPMLFSVTLDHLSALSKHLVCSRQVEGLGSPGQGPARRVS